MCTLIYFTWCLTSFVENCFSFQKQAFMHILCRSTRFETKSNPTISSTNACSQTKDQNLKQKWPHEGVKNVSFVSVNCDWPFLIAFLQFSCNCSIFPSFILFFFLHLVKGNYILSEIGCESFYKDTLSAHVLKEQILDGKFKIRANYASSDYKTVGSIEISALKRRWKWLANLEQPAIRSNGKVKSWSDSKRAGGGCVW